MQLTTAEIADVTGGRLVGDDVTTDGASIDSRAMPGGALFVPVVADRDGHDWIPAAVSGGAAATLASRPIPGASVPVIEVADTVQALQALGRHARERLDCPVIGITGSVGKTTVKDLTAAALSASMVVHASEKSFNNEMGVPLTLLASPAGVGAVVVEMGARGVGHIAELCAIAAPTIGVVTMVAAVHTSEFGDLATVAKAKGELIEALPSNGTAILNLGSEPVAAMAHRAGCRVVGYGPGGEVTATNVDLDRRLRASFLLTTPAGSVPVTLPVPGAHQVENALAAATVATALNCSLDSIARGLAEAALSPWRMEMTTTPGGATLLNDAYNANPTSVTAALEALAAVDADRRFAVLGVMAELGDLHDDEHRRMGELAERLGIELIAFREDAYGVDSMDDFAEIEARLGNLGGRDAVLVKGSRVAALEEFATRLSAG